MRLQITICTSPVSGLYATSWCRQGGITVSFCQFQRPSASRLLQERSTAFIRDWYPLPFFLNQSTTSLSMKQKAESRWICASGIRLIEMIQKEYLH